MQLKCLSPTLAQAQVLAKQYFIHYHIDFYLLLLHSFSYLQLLSHVSQIAVNLMTFLCPLLSE